MGNLANKQKQPSEYHEFIIIGGGISGLQAALILAENNKDFVLLQASDRLGGRIRTQILGEVVQKQQLHKPWMTQEMLNVTFEMGATWVSKQHSFLLKMLQNYELPLFPQYSDGLVIYGLNQKKYEKVESLTNFYKKYQKQLVKLINKIQNLTLNMQELFNSRSSPHQNQLLQEYIKYYDSMTVTQFVKDQIGDQQLVDIILNQMESLECISCDNFSVLQLIDDSSCMELLRLYCEKVDDSIDGMRFKYGTHSVIKAMHNHLFQILQENQSQYNRPDIIQLNSPVTEIYNELGEDVIVKLKNGKRFSCTKVLFTVPVAVANQIKISRISQSKRMIFQNQEYGSVTRFYFVFPEAFWRGKYSGYCAFSRKFPFNELADLSPSTLTCGIIAFLFVHNKFENWKEQVQKANPQTPDVQPLLINYMLKVLADMFLNGNTSAVEIQNYITYSRSFKQMEYIRAAYQTTTKPYIWKAIKESGDDYRDSYCRDEYNIVYIGSELQDAEKHGCYMEGAIRIARKKVYEQLGKEDPWKYLQDKVIEW